MSLSGRLVWIDANANGRRDAAERSARTGLSGRFRITGVPLGSNLLRISTPSGWYRTNPTRGAHNVVLTYDGQAQTRSFGMTDRIIVRGSVFEDRNRNGVFDTILDRIPSTRFWVFADSDGDGRFDTGETLVRADARGQWRMELSRPGTYQIRVVMRSGWMPTTAAVRTLSVSAGVAPAPVEFGIRRVI